MCSSCWKRSKFFIFLLSYIDFAMVQNNPLYIKTFDPSSEGLKLHYIVHTSLDVVEEKGSMKASFRSD